jgi:hypothetical protein
VKRLFSPVLKILPFFLLVGVWEGCQKSADENQPLWLSTYDFYDLKSVVSLYGVPWGISPEKLKSSSILASRYQPRKAADFFEGEGKEFFPDWKDSFESGSETGIGWKKGLRKFYLFSNPDSSECLVFQFYDNHLNKIYHQFLDGSNFSLEDLAEEPYSEHEHRYLADILGVRKDANFPYTGKNVALNGFFLHSLYGVTWGANPEMVRQSKLTTELLTVSPEEIRNLHWTIDPWTGNEPKLEPIKAALSAPKVEANATESKGNYYYFFRTNEPFNNDYLTFNFESEKLQRIDILFGSSVKLNGLLLTVEPSSGSTPSSHPLLTCSGVTIGAFILFLLFFVIGKNYRKRRREQDLIERGRRNDQSTEKLARRDHFK